MPLKSLIFTTALFVRQSEGKLYIAMGTEYPWTNFASTRMTQSRAVEQFDQVQLRTKLRSTLILEGEHDLNLFEIMIRYGELSTKDRVRFI